MDATDAFVKLAAFALVMVPAIQAAVGYLKHCHLS